MIMKSFCKLVISIRKYTENCESFKCAKIRRKIDYLLSVYLVGVNEALQLGLSTKTPKVAKHKPKVNQIRLNTVPNIYCSLFYRSRKPLHHSTEWTQPVAQHAFLFRLTVWSVLDTVINSRKMPKLIFTCQIPQSSVQNVWNQIQKRSQWNLRDSPWKFCSKRFGSFSSFIFNVEFYSFRDFRKNINFNGLHKSVRVSLLWGFCG